MTGQVGYAWSNVLFYAKGGAMVVSDKYEGFTTATGFVFDRANETRWGGAVGAGLDFGVTPNIVVGVDYDARLHGIARQPLYVQQRHVLARRSDPPGR